MPHPDLRMGGLLGSSSLSCMRLPGAAPEQGAAGARALVSIGDMAAALSHAHGGAPRSSMSVDTEQHMQVRV